MLSVSTSSSPSWNLSDLYAGPDDPRLNATLDEAKTEAEAFAARYAGKLAALTTAELNTALSAYERLLQNGAKPGYFVNLRFAADSAPENGALLQNVRERTTAAFLPTLFFPLELTALGVERLTALAADPLLSRWKHYLNELQAQAAHQLSEAEERILEEKANSSGRAFVRLYEEVMNNLRFPLPDRETPLTLAEVVDLQQSPDRELRRASAEALTTGLNTQAHAVTFIFNTLLQDKAVNDRLRHYDYPEQARHLANELTTEIVEAVTTAAEEGYPLVARFYSIKKRLLGLPTLTHYDRYAPLTGGERDIPWEDARTRILTAFGKFDADYAAAARDFFDGNWIDAPPRPHKRGGAFCTYVTPDLHPYIFLNYLGKSGDVRTLAHELGHGVHSSLSREQGYLDFQGTLPMAEVASTFAEQLVFDDTTAALQAAGDDAGRLAEYARQIEQAIATLFRQNALYRFEQAIHAERREKGELTTARFNELWQEKVGAMFGDSVTLEDGHANWWMYIRHFVATPFYVYAYTFGIMLALALYHKYRTSNDPTFASRYLTMLRAGGSQTPQELVAPLGVDLTDAAFWRGAVEVLAAQVDAFERLARETIQS